MNGNTPLKNGDEQMLRKIVITGMVCTLSLLTPLYTSAEGAATNNTGAMTANSATGTLNPNNMGRTDMTGTPVTPGPTGTTGTTRTNTYTGTESIKGTDHYDMSGTGMNTIRTNNYRATATDGARSNWSWIGLLGLIGLAGLFGRGRNENRDPV